MLLAQAASTGASPLSFFAEYIDLGFIVVFAALFFLGKIRREAEVVERDARIAKLEAAITEYTQHYQQEVLPALIDVTKVSGEVVAFLNKRRS